MLMESAYQTMKLEMPASVPPTTQTGPNRFPLIQAMLITKWYAHAVSHTIGMMNSISFG